VCVCVCVSLEGNLFAFFEEKKSIFRKISKLISVAVKNFCELKVVLPLKATIMMEEGKEDPEAESDEQSNCGFAKKLIN